MVPDHWSNDAMVSMDRCGLLIGDAPVQHILRYMYAPNVVMVFMFLKFSHGFSGSMFCWPCLSGWPVGLVGLWVLDHNDPSKPSHRLTNGPEPSKTIESDGSKIKNH